MVTTPLVSVLMITYNHERFIRQCLEGIVTQEANFEFEVILGEDCSTDNTRQIIKEFECKYPDIIKPIYIDENVGALRNVYEVCIPKLRGTYVACLEGDDYWTDPFKLKKQVDFLEGNTDVLICGHYVSELDDNDNRIDEVTDVRLKQSLFNFATNGCNGVYTCSMMYRNTDLFKNYIKQPWIYKLDGADHLFLLLASLEDKCVHVLPENMAVYRKHATGVWTSSNNIKKAMGGLLNNYLYKKHLPIKQEERMYFDWNDRKHLTQIIYAQKRPLPAPINRLVNKVLSTLPDLVGMKIYSAILHPLYLKAYNIHFEDSDGK